MSWLSEAVISSSTSSAVLSDSGTERTSASVDLVFDNRETSSALSVTAWSSNDSSGTGRVTSFSGSLAEMLATAEVSTDSHSENGEIYDPHEISRENIQEQKLYQFSFI